MVQILCYVSNQKDKLALVIKASYYSGQLSNQNNSRCLYECLAKICKACKLYLKGSTVFIDNMFK